MFGDKLYDNVGFPTPTDIPETTEARAFCIPASTAWFALVMGCLMQLAEEENWQQFDGGISPADAAAAAQDIIDSGYDGTCAVSSNIQTPFWDDATDVDDEYPADTQPWYGEVTNPDDPPDELTFVDNAAIWTFTGMLALSGEVGAAILFHTIAPSFLIAMRANDFTEVVRIILDGEEQARIDTSGHSGEIMRIPVVGDPAVSPHELLLVKVS